MIAAIFLISLGAYLLCGIAFAIPFVLKGPGRIDPHAAHRSWGFRVLIIPGVTALWPLLLSRWTSGLTAPPEECNAHRRAIGNIVARASRPCGEDRDLTGGTPVPLPASDGAGSRAQEAHKAWGGLSSEPR